MKITLDLQTVANNTLHCIGAALYVELKANDQAVTRTMYQEVVLEIERRKMDGKALRKAYKGLPK